MSALPASPSVAPARFLVVWLALVGCGSDPPASPPTPPAVGPGAAGGSGGSGGSSRGPAGSGGGSTEPGTGGAPGAGGAGGSGGGGGAPAAPDGGGGGVDAGAPAATPPMGRRFGSRPQAYPAGSIRPTGTPEELDAAVKAAYDRWKAAYVTAACDGYVVKSEGGYLTSSTGLATGMILTAFLAGHDPDAQKIFDGLFAVGRKFPSYLHTMPARFGPRPGNEALPAYAVGAGCQTVDAGDSSVRGDLEFAFGLLLADAQWGSAGAVAYLAEAKKTIAAIQKYDFNQMSRMPLIGDWSTLPGEPRMWTTTGPVSSFMFGHFRAYARAEGTPWWTETVETLQTLTAKTVAMYSPQTGLLPWYLQFGTTPPGGAIIGDQNAGHYFGRAGSLPFRFAADYLASGDARSKAVLDKMLAFIQTKTAGDPSKIVDGYRRDGSNLGTRGTMSYIAPFASAAIFDAANQAWLDATWKLMVAAPSAGVTADTDNLFNMILVSGNWWQP